MQAVTITTAMHEAMAEDAKQRVEVLRRELAEAESVEAYHRRKAGMTVNGSTFSLSSAPSPPTPPTGNKTANPYAKMMMHEAVAAALRKLGPSALGSVVDEFVSAGFMAGKKRVKIYNATYRAVTRKADWFKKGENDQWHLLEGANMNKK